MRALADVDDEVLEARQLCRLSLRLRLLRLLLLLPRLIRERRLVRRVWRGREGRRSNRRRIISEGDDACRLERDVLYHVVGHGLAHELHEFAVVERPREERGRVAELRRGGHDEDARTHGQVGGRGGDGGG